jgi:hypothetical protein
MKRFLGAAILLSTLIVSNSISANDSNAVANARELGSAAQEHMITAYSCQRYLGGISHYQAAKLSATDLYTRISGDRNDAVIAVSKIDEQIKSQNLDKKIELKFKKMKLSHVDGIGTCQQLIQENYDKIELLKARLRLM